MRDAWFLSCTACHGVRVTVRGALFRLLNLVCARVIRNETPSAITAWKAADAGVVDVAFSVYLGLRGRALTPGRKG